MPGHCHAFPRGLRGCLLCPCTLLKRNDSANLFLLSPGTRPSIDLNNRPRMTARSTRMVALMLRVHVWRKIGQLCVQKRRKKVPRPAGILTGISRRQAGGLLFSRVGSFEHTSALGQGGENRPKTPKDAWLVPDPVRCARWTHPERRDGPGSVVVRSSGGAGRPSRASRRSGILAGNRPRASSASVRVSR
jgi:hypothetical protein